VLSRISCTDQPAEAGVLAGRSHTGAGCCVCAMPLRKRRMSPRAWCLMLDRLLRESAGDNVAACTRYNARCMHCALSKSHSRTAASHNDVLDQLDASTQVTDAYQALASVLSCSAAAYARDHEPRCLAITSFKRAYSCCSSACHMHPLIHQNILARCLQTAVGCFGQARDGAVRHPNAPAPTVSAFDHLVDLSRAQTRRAIVTFMENDECASH
jgi:hypothetical protein